MIEIVDLFCGIGGVAEAWPTTFRVTHAIDIDRRVVPIYRANHGVIPQVRSLDSLRKVPDADLWWLSPPCQPYTTRGKRRAEGDARSAALSHLLGRVAEQRPRLLVLENVPGFAGSSHHQRLRSILGRRGYAIREDLVCPTHLGIPMRRHRFYLRAALGSDLADIETAGEFQAGGLPEVEATQMAAVGCENRPVARSRLRDFLDPAADPHPSLLVEPAQRERFGRAMRVADPDDPAAVVGCFTAAYGSSPVGAGSYLRMSDGRWRRFTPQEIGRLMGFREGFFWPDDLGTRSRYRLLGNSLAVNVVRVILDSLRPGNGVSATPQGPLA